MLFRSVSNGRVLTRLGTIRYAASVPGSNITIRIPKDKLVPEDSEMLQPISIEDMPRAQQRFAKQFEKLNYERIKEIFEKNKKNIIGFIILSCVVVSIYVYTIYAVKQETFLEEIDEEVAAEKGEVLPSASTNRNATKK